jgi:hypothetical protein
MMIVVREDGGEEVTSVREEETSVGEEETSVGDEERNR